MNSIEPNPGPRASAWLAAVSLLLAACGGAGEVRAEDESLQAAIEETIVELRERDRGITALDTEALRIYVEARLGEVDRAVAAASAAGHDHLVDRVAAARRQIEQELDGLAGLDAYERADARLRIGETLVHVEQALARAGHPVALPAD